ncbi:flagellin [Solibacillus sp. CAU 1738]|uniref:flagellin N-terminal helical domain-containing protein n=1 Tax=Solibacillus sp. CAU 1738 TaxID=3140363 RepID=UPI00326040FF
MRIKHNISSLNTNNRLQNNRGKLEKSLEKLSSGFKINRAGDDAAGLAISEKMLGQIRGLDMAGKNIQDGISLVQTAEGALNEVHSLLQRGRELSVQASNDTNTDIDREAIQKEIEEIKKEITSIGNNTEFNTKKLLDGSVSYQTNPSTPQSTLKATGAGGGSFTVDDGWIDFGNDPSNQHKAKLNEGEKVIDDPANWLFTKLSIGVYYDNGVPQSLSIHSIPDGFIITHNNPSLIFSYNGITIDLSQSKPPNGSSGSQHQGNIDLTAGNNDGEIINDVDNSLNFQIGANSGQTINLSISDVRSQAIGIDNVSVLNNALAQYAISSFDSAINAVSGVRSNLGAYQNRLEHTYNSVSNTSENLQSAESRIRDTDMAKEMMNFTKSNILIQAAQSMLAQSNKQPEGVLQLLQ